MPLYLEYYFWLLLISVGVGVLERVWPRHPGQKVFRAEWDQDLFWLLFNTHFVSWMLALAGVQLARWFQAALPAGGGIPWESLRLLSDWPWLLQFAVCFVVKDFIEWNVHRLMHVVPWLWRFHRLHHSIEQLDWLAAFRGHWAELVILNLVAYLPMVVLGVADSVVFAIVAVQTLLHELTHANLPWGWGRLGYVFNSPRLHAWHHDVALHGRHGQNFSISLSLWDWLFGTAYLPQQPETPARLGFEGMERYPRGIWGRLWDPIGSGAGGGGGGKASPQPRVPEAPSGRDGG
jgi:sterol desaturase/sphingolipid hydroxylase (fatty acid hydroxylase superfamily)